MQNTADLAIQKRTQHLREIESVGGSGIFVGYGGDFVFLARFLHDPIDKARTVRTEDPRDTHHQMVGTDREDTALSFQLGFAVNTARIRRVILAIGLRRFAIENIIGAEMNEPRVFLRADFCKSARLSS